MSSDESYAESWVDTNNGLTYELEKSESNTARITGWNEEVKNVKIPSKITVSGVEYEVKAIDQFIFVGKGIESVEIGSNIDIDSKAFMGCKSLKSVTIAEGITIISSNTFKDCTALKEVVIPSTVVKIDTSAFENDESIDTIDLSKVEVIAKAAFKGCKAISAVNLSSINQIANQAFQNCKSLKTCNLGENLTQIGQFAFKGTGIKEFNLSSVFKDKFSSVWWPESTEAINIDPLNPNLYSDDGVVYRKDMSVMYLIPPSKTGEYTVLANPSSKALVQLSLDKLSFLDSVAGSVQICAPSNNYGSSSIKEVILSPNITFNHSSSFVDCSQLERVDLGGVTKLSGCFKNCGNLKEVVMKNVETISGSFIECPKLNLVLPESIKTFDVVSDNNNAHHNIHVFNVDSITFPSNEVAKALKTNLVKYNPSTDKNEMEYPALDSNNLDELANKTLDVLDFTKGSSCKTVRYVVNSNQYLTIMPYSTVDLEYYYYLDEDGNPFLKNAKGEPASLPSIKGEPSYEVPDKEGYVTMWLPVEGKDKYYQLYYAPIYKASFIDDAGNTISEIEFTEKEGISNLPEVPAKEGYLGSWIYEIKAENMTVTPTYAPILYTATFVDEAGNTVGKTEFTVRDKILDEPEVPVKDGYDGSWTYEIKAGNMVVTPKYVASEEEDSDNGSNTMIYVVVAVVVVIIAAIVIAYVKRN